jgi:hypothetical protein
MATTPQVVNVYPAPDSKGIVLSDRVIVTFDQEMDETTINSGTFVLLGRETTTTFSPIDITPFDTAGFEDEDILSSPYVTGYIKGTITFQKVDISGGSVDDSTMDYTGAGNLWLTQAIFTPDKPLEPNSDYTAILAGDESATDSFASGIKTRTVFDTQKTAGTGNAEIIFYGGFTGSVNSSYTVQFTSAGAVGVAEYVWWEDSDPLTVYQGISTTGERELEYGVYVSCEPDGSFAVGDTFNVVVVPAITLENNYRWSFSTGSGSIQTPPSSFSASGIDALTTPDYNPSSFYVSSTLPRDREYGVDISTDPYVGEEITITFSENLDLDSITDDRIEIISESATGEEDIQATGVLAYSASATENIITISLDPGQLFENNIITIKLLKEIQSEDSIQLNADYTFFFSTTYNPLYTSKRRIYLDLGNLVANVPEETIMLAILEASRAANSLSFVTYHSNQQYFEFARREYTTCLAELLLLKGIMGDVGLSDRMSKTLGDLSVSRGGLGLNDRKQKLEDCVAYWQTPLSTGGIITPGASLLPQVAVKGRYAEDAIAVCRQWQETSGPYTNSTPAANHKTYASGRRRLRTFRKR